MERRRFESKLKSQIVLEGLRGRSVSELCNEYSISQGQYYKWRDQFLENSHEVFETSSKDRFSERLKSENKKLKSLVGELTMELKKNDW